MIEPKETTGNVQRGSLPEGFTIEGEPQTFQPGPTITKQTPGKTMSNVRATRLKATPEIEKLLEELC